MISPKDLAESDFEEVITTKDEKEIEFPVLSFGLSKELCS
jgi:hypothetical protein